MQSSSLSAPSTHSGKPQNHTYFVLSNQMIARSRSREKGERVNWIIVRVCVCNLKATDDPLQSPPWWQGSKRGPKAGHPSLPSLPEGLLHQLGLGGRIQTPKASFPRLVLRAGHFQEVAVQRQIVSDWVLEKGKTFCHWKQKHQFERRESFFPAYSGKSCISRQDYCTCQPLSAVR